MLLFGIAVTSLFAIIGVRIAKRMQLCDTLAQLCTDAVQLVTHLVSNDGSGGRRRRKKSKRHRGHKQRYQKAAVDDVMDQDDDEDDYAIDQDDEEVAFENEVEDAVEESRGSKGAMLD